jgi:hypothetical protein
MTTKTKKFIHDAQTTLKLGDKGEHYTKTTQFIPPEYLNQLKAEKEDSMAQREGEFMRVASIPVAVHEQWLREGFDMMKEPAKATIKRLRDQQLDAFITTNKSV